MRNRVSSTVGTCCVLVSLETRVRTLSFCALRFVFNIFLLLRFCFRGDFFFHVAWPSLFHFIIFFFADGGINQQGGSTIHVRSKKKDRGRKERKRKDPQDIDEDRWTGRSALADCSSAKQDVELEVEVYSTGGCNHCFSSCQFQPTQRVEGWPKQKKRYIEKSKRGGGRKNKTRDDGSSRVRFPSCICCLVKDKVNGKEGNARENENKK